jgi:Ras-related protein Rab-1A
VTACHYRNAKGVIIVYDVTNRESFYNIKVWLNDAQQLASKESVKLLLGNKTDVDKYSERSKIRQVSFQEGYDFAV